MATTSPDNLRTPDPGDPYNLVPDLATLANDVQDALNNRGNSYRGTASERVAFLPNSSLGMIWQDTDGIGMIWKRGASDWEPAVRRWAGTTSSMNSFTQAPDGFEWYSSTDGLTYLRVNNAWNGGILWSGSNVLSTGSVTLSQPISQQPTGIVLVWSTTSGDSGQSTDFIPKAQVAAVSGGDYRFYMGTGGVGAGGVLPNVRKLVTITNTQISGNSANATAPSDGYALRRVISV